MTLETGLIGKAARAYQRLIDYFVPEAVRSDRQTSNQARMFLISHTMGPVLGNTVPLALYFFDPTPGPEILILALSITGFWLFPPLLKIGVDYTKLVLTSVLNLNFCILWSCYFYGGVSSPMLPWILIIPILSLFYLGGEKRLQPHLLGISGACFTVFIASYAFFQPPEPDVPTYAAQGLGLISTIAALCYVATMAIYYSRIFDAGIEMENEVKRRMQATDELREAVAYADRVASMKSEFLARMSHELRTPLNAVLGYAELLREDAEESGDDYMSRDVNRIHDAATYLIRMINMILDLSKIEAGKMSFDYRPNDLSACIKGAVEAKKELIAENNNRVELHLADFDAVFDEGRVDQVLQSVVENAARHTENGVITVASRIFNFANGKEMVQIDVRDTGAGIKLEDMATVFETFSASREASDGRYGGTGLSLTVARKLCQAMGGSINVQSQWGVGSTFIITLPLHGHVQMTDDEMSSIQVAGRAKAA